MLLIIANGRRKNKHSSTTKRNADGWRLWLLLVYPAGLFAVSGFDWAGVNITRLGYVPVYSFEEITNLRKSLHQKINVGID